MEVEESNIITKSSDQSNMGIAIGKRYGKNNELNMLVITASKFGLNFPASFPYQQIQRIY